jgi:hypothetical protein
MAMGGDNPLAAGSLVHKSLDFLVGVLLVRGVVILAEHSATRTYLDKFGSIPGLESHCPRTFVDTVAQMDLQASTAGVLPGVERDIVSICMPPGAADHGTTRIDLGTHAITILHHLVEENTVAAALPYRCVSGIQKQVQVSYAARAGDDGIQLPKTTDPFGQPKKMDVAVPEPWHQYRHMICVNRAIRFWDVGLRSDVPNFLGVVNKSSVGKRVATTWDQEIGFDKMHQAIGRHVCVCNGLSRGDWGGGCQMIMLAC